MSFLYLLVSLQNKSFQKRKNYYQLKWEIFFLLKSKVTYETVILEREIIIYLIVLIGIKF